MIFSCWREFSDKNAQDRSYRSERRIKCHKAEGARRVNDWLQPEPTQAAWACYLLEEDGYCEGREDREQQQWWGLRFDLAGDVINDQIGEETPNDRKQQSKSDKHV